MRRYTITVNDTPHVIDVEEVTADTFRVQYQGRLIDVRLDSHDDLAQALITPNVEVHSEIRDLPTASVPTAARVAAPIPAAPTSSPAPATGGGDGLTAPMPGVVLEVTVAAGARVSKGDPLLVLEAMKMKNSLHASRDAVVKAVHVSAGQQVRYGEVLVTYEDA